MLWARAVARSSSSSCTRRSIWAFPDTPEVTRLNVLRQDDLMQSWPLHRYAAVYLPEDAHLSADLSTHNLSTGRLAELEGPPRCEQGSTSCKLPLALRRGFAFSEAAVRATFASETCGVWSSSSKVGIERRWRAQWIAETYS
jgi:hypothetical protein